MTLLRRFRERRLVQWLLAYLVSAWLVLQVAEVLGGIFLWPVSWLQGLTLILVAGFPVAVVLSWYHGEKGHQRATASEFLVLALVALPVGLFLGALLPRADLDAPLVSVGELPGTAEPESLGNLRITEVEPVLGSVLTSADLEEGVPIRVIVEQEPGGAAAWSASQGLPQLVLLVQMGSTYRRLSTVDSRNQIALVSLSGMLSNEDVYGGRVTLIIAWVVPSADRSRLSTAWRDQVLLEYTVDLSR